MDLERSRTESFRRTAAGIAAALFLAALAGAACGAAWPGPFGATGSYAVIAAAGALSGAALACIAMLVARRDGNRERAAELALRTSEERLRATLDNTPAVAVQWCDIEGRVQYWNRASEELYGFTSAEALGKTLDQLILTAEQAAQYHALLEEMALTGRSFGPAEIELRRKDGAPVQVLYTSFAIPEIGGGRIFVCMDVDITERKHAEAMMDRIVRGVSHRVGAAFFSGVVEFLAAELPADMVYIAEPLRGDGRVRTIACCRDGRIAENFEYPLRGTPCERAIEGSHSALHPEGVCELFPEAEVLRSLGVEGYACIALTDSAGMPLGILVALTRQPIRRSQFFQSLLELAAGRAAAELERARSEKALREREEQYRELFEFTPLPLFVRSEDTLEILDVNLATVEKYGYTREEFQAMTTYELQSSGSRESYLASLRRRAPDAIDQVHRLHVTKDGRELEMEVTSRPVAYQGRPARLVVARDVTDWLSAERALRESEQQYRALFDQAAVGVTVCDLELRYLQVNDKYCEMIGYSREELLRMTARDVNFPEYVDEAVAYRRRLAAAETDSSVRVKPLRRKDGSTVWISAVISVVRDAAGKAQRYIAVIQDVTEQKRAEQALAAQRAFLRQVIDLDRNFIFAKDREGRFVLVNRAVAEAYGTTVEALTGRTDADFNANPDEVGHFRRDDLEVMDTLREKFIAEERITDAAGAVRWLQTVKRPIQADAGAAHLVLGVATDITEHKRAQEALAEERNLLRAVIDNLPELVFVKDLEHRFVLANTAWIDVRAKGDASIIGRRLSDMYSPAIGARSEAEDREVFRSGRPSREREVELTDARGEQRCYVVRKTPLRDAAGGIVGLVGISRDVTEDRQHVEDLARFTAGLEARVRERTAQLERANRELEAFTFSVSHDLRAPLRAIDGFSERVLIESAGRLGPKAEGYVQRVRLASQRMTRLIDNLLELSQTGRREPHRRFVDVSALASEIGAELREAEPGRNVRLAVQPGIAAVADGELLRIVLDNLLRNAWKFTSGRAQAEIEVGWERRDGRMVYFVRDNGAGFDMRRAGRLFAPFQRLHRAADFPGTGIGLAVAQRVVRRHLGEIWAQAEVDQGATFYFTLDAGDAHGAAADATAAADRPASRAERSPQERNVAGEIAQNDLPAVLVVDDDEDVVEVLREELGRDGHLIVTAPDGQTGLEVLERNNVAVVVSDYSMPGMTGTEFLAAVRARHPGVVRMLFTGRPDVRVLSEAVNEAGVHFLVQKDWDHLYLRARVRESVIAAAQRG